MRIKTYGMKGRFLVFYEDGENVEPFIVYKKVTYRRIDVSPLRPTEKELYSEAHIYGR